MDIDKSTLKKYAQIVNIIFSKSGKKNKAVYVRGDQDEIILFQNDILKEKFIFGCDKLIKFYKKLDENSKNKKSDLL